MQPSINKDPMSHMEAWRNKVTTLSGHSVISSRCHCGAVTITARVQHSPQESGSSGPWPGPVFIVSRNETKRKPHPQIYWSSVQAPCVFSVLSLVLWLTANLGSVSEVRLNVFFAVYYLLWQLLSCVVLAGHFRALC